jgi:hypothetical protein
MSAAFLTRLIVSVFIGGLIWLALVYPMLRRLFAPLPPHTEDPENGQ